MSREIKYRVWDEEKKEYIDGLFLLAPDSKLYERVDDFHFPERPSDRYIVEQYTDLKDTNGKEICEGDIVMMLDYHAKIAGMMECLKTDIRWDKENACYILGVTKFGSKLLLHNPETYVIVGNIHENPGLLISYQQGELNKGDKK